MLYMYISCFLDTYILYIYVLYVSRGAYMLYIYVSRIRTLYIYVICVPAGGSRQITRKRSAKE